MKKIPLAFLTVSLLALSACEDDPTMRPDYTVQVVPTGAGHSIAVPPVCPSWTTDNRDIFDNQPDPQFGCSTARNLAFSVENPNDLIDGRNLSNARGVTAVGAIKRYDNNQTRGLIIPGSETNAVAATTAAAAASAMTGDTSAGAASASTSAPAASSGAAQ